MFRLVVASLAAAIAVTSSGPNAVGQAPMQGDAPAPSPDELREQANPGPEHERLKRLSGTWDVEMRPSGSPAGTTPAGTCAARMVVEDRFLELDFATGDGTERQAHRYLIGFDRRHGEYVVVAMDTYGTYFVTARGKPAAGGKPAADSRILMFGEDDDPVMSRMGLKKKFAFELRFDGNDRFALKIFFVDTRTKEENLLPFAEYVFARKT